MKAYHPTYYHSFRCIAADCPDSCCRGWDVVIDDETERFYAAVQGGLGERLRKAIYTDGDGDHVFYLADNKKCPFWGEDRLCDIYRELGEERLCATCAQFPRIRMEYEGFTERALALSCPEAARLILSTDGAYADFTLTSADGCADYSAAEISLLLQTRRKAADILSADKPLPERLNELLCFSIEAQKELTGCAEADESVSAAGLFERMEYIDDSSRIRILNAAAKTPDLSRYERELTRAAAYFLYRYWLGAVVDLDVIAPAGFIILSIEVIASLAEELGDIVTAAQLYSKEIEQSYENMERIWLGIG